jgi:malate dehydrogenase (oxaloacetate-decarboxylating)(NADP+)
MLTLFFSRNRDREPSYRPLFAAKSDEVAARQQDVYDASRAYHRRHPAGKMSTVTTKPLATQADLSLAYSPGVAAPCRDIEASPDAAFELTNKSNTVAVISNGTAVLGLGNIGALASKPVMEGKAALFKTFAGIDAVDICVDESDPRKLAEIVSALGPSFGGINLEDIKAPDCFVVEDFCRSRMDIPVFHDDQHGTATVIMAGLINALELTGRRLGDIRLVVSGAGAAAIATLDLLTNAGLSKENVTLIDSAGVVSTKRKDIEPRRAVYAQGRGAPKDMAAALKGADVFLGVSKAGMLNPAWIRSMAKAPIIFALANPEPEVWPEHAREAAPDAILATGRSDYPNQVNNVLCFPFLFRGALDCRATSITPGMQRAAADAIAKLARSAPGEETVAAYPDDDFVFGQTYILPKPFDRRLREVVPAAVIEAARAEGVARS